VQPASMLGAVFGGWRADVASRRFKMGRMLVQGGALLLAVPCVYVSGQTSRVSTLILVLIAWGALKGAYEASIFASMFDVTDPFPRERIVGIMNLFAWIAAAIAAPLTGRWADHMHAINRNLLGHVSANHKELGRVISSSCGLYAIASACLFAAAWVFVREADTNARNRIVVSEQVP